MGIALFMSSATGRILRVVAGLLMIVLGMRSGTTGGYILAIAGFVPLALGMLNWCLFAPLLGVPFKGSDLKR